MNLDSLIFGSVLFVIFVGFIVGLLWKFNPEPIRHMLGIVVIRDQDDEAIRRNIIAVCKGIDVSKLRIDEAEFLLEETARHATAEHFAKVNPGKTYKVTPHWPMAKCVISGNIAVVRVILGHDYMGDHDGLRAVNFEVDREHKVLQLRPWAPKQPEPAPDGRPERIAAQAARHPKPTPTPSKPTPRDKIKPGLR